MNPMTKPIPPLVTIGVPVHNGERYLRSALQSLVAQDYSNVELVISDNASTDGTRAICDEFVAAHRHIRYHRQSTNVGASRNFNGLFEAAQGKYFMWAACDDQWLPSFVTRCVDWLERLPTVVLCGADIEFIDETDRPTSYPRRYNRLHTLGMPLRRRASALTERLDWFAIYGVIRASALKETRLTVERYGSDVILLMELLLRGRSMVIPEPLFRYRFIQKTAEQHLQDIAGPAATGGAERLRPYTGLAQDLLDVIRSSDVAPSARADLERDFLQNITSFGTGWRGNILAENPDIGALPPPSITGALEKLVSPLGDVLPRHESPEHDRREATVTKSTPTGRSTFGFNVIGFVSSNIGLGVCARSLIDALATQGHPVAVLDLDPGEGRYGHDLRYSHLAVPSWDKLPYTVNLVVFPLASADAALMAGASALNRADRINVMCVLWELTVMPKRWQRAVECFDVVIALSDFIRHTIDASVSGPVVVPALCPLSLPDGIAADRARFGIADSDIAFITSLELGSDPTRKNALAVVAAFTAGLAGVADARLIVKLNNVDATAPPHPYLQALRDAAERDRRIRIVAETLSYRDVLSLYKSADVYVSLHRAEGLGLGPLEAMALGKPVVATGWSGNMVYMDHCNACLVPYTLVPVAASVPAYSQETLAGLQPTWAEPDVHAAAMWMKRLAQDAGLREAVGRRAADAAARYQATAMRAGFADELAAIWDDWQHRGFVPDRIAKIRALAAAAPVDLDAAEESAPAAEDPVTRFRRKVGQFLDERVLKQGR